jgi:hypothetical protein
MGNQVAKCRPRAAFYMEIIDSGVAKK